MNANELQIRVWSNDGSDNPFTYPFHALAFSQDSGMGPEYGQMVTSRAASSARKPEGDLAKQLEDFDKAKGVPAEERIALGQDINKLMAENVWIIGTVGVSPAMLGHRGQEEQHGQRARPGRRQHARPDTGQRAAGAVLLQGVTSWSRAVQHL